MLAIELIERRRDESRTENFQDRCSRCHPHWKKEDYRPIASTGQFGFVGRTSAGEEKCSTVELSFLFS
jgi:hypothetical protein